MLNDDDGNPVLEIDSIRKANAIIRITYGIDPDTLSDEEFARLVTDYAFVKRFDSQIYKINMQNALVEVLNDLFPEQVQKN